MITNKHDSEDKTFKNLQLLTITLIFFIMGLFYGEVSFDIHNASKMIGGLATVVSLALGTKIFAAAVRRRLPLIAVTVFSIWIGNFALAIGIYSVELVDIILSVSTILAMVVMYKHLDLKNEKLITRSGKNNGRNEQN